ncbi:MAG: transcriptional regulator [Nitrospira sp.]|nr:MAG: transcriptional regulator [Nitrospira sp.]
MSRWEDRRDRTKKARTRVTPGSGNVFLDFGFPPHEATVMLLRCELAEALSKWMTREGLPQAQAAKHLGVVQSRISEIAFNKLDELSLDYLVGLSAKAGLTVAVKFAA